MVHTDKRRNSRPSVETPPTVALNTNGHLEESTPGQPGAITLSSKKDFNVRGNFDREMKVHYEPDSNSTLDRIIYNVCMAGEMAAHVGSLSVSKTSATNEQFTLILKFPRPESNTIPIGERGVMIEHPQCLYGDNPHGVEVIYDRKRNELIQSGTEPPLVVSLDNFPKLKEKITESLK